jgi:hypothetical protein
MFCTNCGSDISEDVEVCPQCGENLEEAISLLEETPVISKTPPSDSEFKITLRRDPVPAYAKVTILDLFIKNVSPNTISDVELQLSGSHLVEVVSENKFLGTFRSGQQKSAVFNVIPKKSGIITIDAKISSDLDHLLIIPIEIDVVNLTRLERETPARSHPQSSIDQALVAFIITSLVGVIFIVIGISTFFRGGLPLSGGITFIVIGVILLSIGTKGRCLVLPFLIVCDDCDC